MIKFGQDPAPLRHCISDQLSMQPMTRMTFWRPLTEIRASQTAPFLGIVLDDARIARVRITTGAVPGADDTPKSDVAMMDDFIYGEPQALP